MRNPSSRRIALLLRLLGLGCALSNANVLAQDRINTNKADIPPSIIFRISENLQVKDPTQVKRCQKGQVISRKYCATDTYDLETWLWQPKVVSKGSTVNFDRLDSHCLQMRIVLRLDHTNDVCLALEAVVDGQLELQQRPARSHLSTGQESEQHP